MQFCNDKYAILWQVNIKEAAEALDSSVTVDTIVHDLQRFFPKVIIIQISLLNVDIECSYIEIYDFMLILVLQCSCLLHSKCKHTHKTQ